MNPHLQSGFEDGAPVPVQSFDYPNDEDGVGEQNPLPRDGESQRLESAFARLFERLVSSGESPEAIGRAVLAVAYIAKIPGAPITQRELARRLGLYLARTNKIVAETKRNLARIGKNDEHDSDR